MSPKVVQHFILAPGGLIQDIPQNQELVKLIANANKLSPKQLYALAAFYQVYQTNASLAEHLTLVALANAICEFGGDDPYWDWFEDQVCGYDNTAEEKKEQVQDLMDEAGLRVYSRDAYKGPYYSRTAVAHVLYEIKCISFPQLPGLGFLIETSNGRDPHVIGVCPILNG